MACRFSLLGIILCIVILYFCQSSAHLRRRVFKRGIPGYPFGNSQGGTSPNSQIQIRSRTWSTGQGSSAIVNRTTVIERGGQRVIIKSSGSNDPHQHQLLEQLMKLMKQHQEQLKPGTSKTFRISSSRVIKGSPRTSQAPNPLPGNLLPRPSQNGQSTSRTPVELLPRPSQHGQYPSRVPMEPPARPQAPSRVQPPENSKHLTPNGFSKEEQAALVQFHNDVRKQVNPPAASMEKMEWSDKLARQAQAYANKCEWRHSDKSTRRDRLNYRFIGENLYISTSYGVTKSVQNWADEKYDYDFWSNKCKPGKLCGHYTQMVWSTTNRVGCGVNLCKTVKFWRSRVGYYVVCNYGPGGNINGARPYQASTGKGTSRNTGQNKKITNYPTRLTGRRTRNRRRNRSSRRRRRN